MEILSFGRRRCGLAVTRPRPRQTLPPVRLLLHRPLTAPSSRSLATHMLQRGPRGCRAARPRSNGGVQWQLLLTRPRLPCRFQNNEVDSGDGTSPALQ
jgi:hypothetical protein